MSQAGDLQDVVFQSTANMRSDGPAMPRERRVVTSETRRSGAVHESYSAIWRRAIRFRNNYYANGLPAAALPVLLPRTDGGDSLSQATMAVDCAAATPAST